MNDQMQISVHPTGKLSDEKWMCTFMWNGKVIYQAHCPRLLKSSNDTKERAEKMFVDHMKNRLYKNDESFDMFTSI